MLRKILLLSISALLVLPILSSVSNAVIVIPSYGETGWQTYSHTFEEEWEGWVGIGVSDFDDEAVPSFLLVDNLMAMGPSGNESFEMADFTGYDTFGTAWISPQVTSLGGTVYTPTDGTYMAVLDSVDGYSGADTPSAFGGTDGSWIEFPVTASAGDEVSFDWNFYTHDYVPFYDFAFLYAAGSAYSTWPEGAGPEYFEILAQVGAPVSEPSMLLLVGSGLIGLAVFGRKLGER